MWNKNVETYKEIWVFQTLYVWHKLFYIIWVHTCWRKINTLSRQIKCPPISCQPFSHVQLYLCSPIFFPLYNNLQLLFCTPKKTAGYQFLHFPAFHSFVYWLFPPFPSAEPAHLPWRDPMELIPRILQLSRSSARFPPVVLGKNPQPCFDSQAQITIPALLFLPAPPVSFPPINPRKCQTGFYTGILSMLSQFKIHGSWTNNLGKQQGNRSSNHHTAKKKTKLHTLEMWLSFPKLRGRKLGQHRFMSQTHFWKTQHVLHIILPTFQVKKMVSSMLKVVCVHPRQATTTTASSSWIYIDITQQNGWRQKAFGALEKKNHACREY